MNWRELLNQRGIPFQDRGPNVSGANIAIRCPFCSDDPSFHMSVSLLGKGWHCWRRPEHKGKSEARLVQVLLGCDWNRACAIAGKPVTDTSNLAARVRAALTSPTEEVLPVLQRSKLFRVIDPQERGVAKAYVNYLRGRGYSDDTIRKLTWTFGMYYATQGDYGGRIIFTVSEDHQLVSWTGRTIGLEIPRYKALGREVTGHPITNYLLWGDKLKQGGRALCLVEGPFDALKVMVLGADNKIRATCFFTSSPSNMQIDKLCRVAAKFDYCYLMLDRGSLDASLRVSSRLLPLGVKVKHLKDAKDPGDMRSRDELLKFLELTPS
jgi:hypothetical protein